MTPVQLPEVPAGFAVVVSQSLEIECSEIHPPRTSGEKLYTADQLRAYATEAVMAERARIRGRVDSLPVSWADYWLTAGDWEMSHNCEAFDAANKWLAANIAAITQPEQNSGR